MTRISRNRPERRIKMSIMQKIICAGLLFIITISTGIWLNSSGRPLNALIFNIHKLTAVAAVIFTAVLIRGLLKNAEIRTFILALIIISILLVLVLFVSGALMSTGKPVSGILVAVHGAATVFTVIAASAAVVLLTLGRR